MNHRRQVIHLEIAYRNAIALVIDGDGDELIVLPNGHEGIPGVETDDGVPAIAAIDLVRHAVDVYEEERDANDPDARTIETVTIAPDGERRAWAVIGGSLNGGSVVLASLNRQEQPA